MTVKDGTCYIIKRDGKRYNNKVFSNYEQARSYVRKKLRNTIADRGVRMEDWAFLHQSNPSITSWGFSIVKSDKTGY